MKRSVCVEIVSTLCDPESRTVVADVQQLLFLYHVCSRLFLFLILAAARGMVWKACGRGIDQSVQSRPRRWACVNGANRCFQSAPGYPHSEFCSAAFPWTAVCSVCASVHPPRSLVVRGRVRVRQRGWLRSPALVAPRGVRTAIRTRHDEDSSRRLSPRRDWICCSEAGGVHDGRLQERTSSLSAFATARPNAQHSTAQHSGRRLVLLFWRVLRSGQVRRECRSCGRTAQRSSTARTGSDFGRRSRSPHCFHRARLHGVAAEFVRSRSRSRWPR